jgi:hypothetical protein
MQCIGRIPAKDEVYFTSGPRLHRNKPLLYLLPKRCPQLATDTLCAHCIHKRDATAASIEKRGDKYIPNQGSLLHGTILEPIPIWSRLYKGIWYLQQIEAGYTLEPDILEKAENAYTHTHKEGGYPSVEMPKKKVEIPVIPVKAEEPQVKPKRNFKKKVIEPVEQVIETQVSETQVIEPPVIEAQVAPKRMAKKKLSTASIEAPIVPPPAPISAPKSPVKCVPTPKPTKATIPVAVGKITDVTAVVPSVVVEIKVKKTTLDGRSVYINYQNDKVYDMKFNYIGRSKDTTIDSSFPDSDAEL